MKIGGKIQVKKRSIILLCLTLCLTILAFAASPADGAWTAVSSAQGAPLALNLAGNGAVLTGSADGAAITGGKIAMSDIWFTWVRGGVTYSYKGTINGTTLRLTEYRADGTAGVRNLSYTRQ
jgi:hypothetical protein